MTPGIRRALPWAVIAFWAAALAVCAPSAIHLTSVQTDSAVDYLPSSADSTRVASVQAELPGSDATRLELVYHRAGGLTRADRVVAGQQVDRVVSGQHLDASPTPRVSHDGTTEVYLISTTAAGSGDEAQDALVDSAREQVNGAHGLTARVTGPAALRSDTGAVFGSIDLTLVIATALVVAVLLVLTYRSPLLWFFPLLSVGVAAITTRGIVYGLVQWTGLTVTGQSGGIMTVLVFGAGTDYALLLVSRYREELRRVRRPYDAMRAALRGCGPALLASGGTVVAGLLCLLAAGLNSSRGLGPVGAVGVLCALAAMTTLLPALLVVLGRRVFWPLVPVYGSEPHAPRRGRRTFFAAVGARAGRRPAAVLAGGAVLLGALALGSLDGPGTLGQLDGFTSPPESVAALRTADAAFPGGQGDPIPVVTATPRAQQALDAARATPGVGSARATRSGKGWTELLVLPRAAPGSAAETTTVTTLRAHEGRVPGTYVGGTIAQRLDQQSTDARDLRIVVPLVLAVVLLILGALLRSVVAPLILVAAVAAVWAAALGIGSLLFGHVLGFAGTDPSLPLLTFVFLVALGVDYGIFLMHRTREERARGATADGAVLAALRTTGGVIASAGIVLAATFSVLTTLPLVMMVETGLVIAVGVLLDTFLVRTWLVTSASLLLGDRLWWPGTTRHATRPQQARAGEHTAA
ncbi:MMPL family transporter [Streptomyces sp. NRRL F-5126]|uniref:MMPL family transporter n=1 Tax=Streptomyces sp. NRRL F-5126 TaxID=1463857 RepID=UPI0004C5FA00|nr:MMPL family transporter [Streptomyces sp. NRRL F-5126]